MKYLLKDKNGNVLFSQIDLGCKQCIMCADNKPILIVKCKLNLKKHKIAKKVMNLEVYFYVPKVVTSSRVIDFFAQCLIYTSAFCATSYNLKKKLKKI